MVKVIWSELAIQDLKQIHEYIALDSKFYADRFIEKIITRVDQLESFHSSDRIVPEFNNEQIRELIEGNNRIVYKIYSDYVGIARVHHAARLFKEL